MIKPNPNSTPPIFKLKNTPEPKPIQFEIQTLWHPDTSGPMRGCAALCRWLCHKIFTPDPNFKPCNDQTKPQSYTETNSQFIFGASRRRFAPSVLRTERLRRCAPAALVAGGLQHKIFTPERNWPKIGHIKNLSIIKPIPIPTPPILNLN